MANTVGVSVRPIRHRVETTAHDHRVLSVLISCPEQRCRRLAIALFGQPTENLRTEWEWLEPSPIEADADERLPGYMREHHLPSFKSQRDTSHRQAAGSLKKEIGVMKSGAVHIYADHRDRLGEKLRQAGKAREDQWAAERDRELLAKMKRKQSEHRPARKAEQRVGDTGRDHHTTWIGRPIMKEETDVQY